LIYTQDSVSGVWDAGVTWNREHVWPQSLLGEEAGGTNIASDLHNLKPADPGTNSSRGNKYFDNVTTSVSYEPTDEVKGDIARILFYMIVMYDYLDLIDGTPDVYEMALLATLLSWHEADPVDDFELNRNDVIYSYQFNRNPFIDYPHFVEMIFGSHSYYS
jgi:endonuclease I